MQKQGYLALFIFLFVVSFAEAVPSWTALENLNEQQVHLTLSSKAPIVVVISPGLDTLSLGMELYQDLHKRLGSQVYFVVSPDLPFFIPGYWVRSKLKQHILGSATAGVLLDWSGDVARFFSADDSQHPMVLRLEKDGTVLGRYHYEAANEAMDFMVFTFPDLFVASEIWATTSAD